MDQPQPPESLAIVGETYATRVVVRVRPIIATEAAVRCLRIHDNDTTISLSAPSSAASAASATTTPHGAGALPRTPRIGSSATSASRVLRTPTRSAPATPGSAKLSSAIAKTPKSTTTASSSTSTAAAQLMARRPRGRLSFSNTNSAILQLSLENDQELERMLGAPPAELTSSSSSSSSSSTTCVVRTFEATSSPELELHSLRHSSFACDANDNTGDLSGSELLLTPKTPARSSDTNDDAWLEGGTDVLPTPQGTREQFVFDRVFREESTQAEVAQEVAPFVEAAVDGYNTAVFTYGQTGAGKTHTMLGDVARWQFESGQLRGEEEGIIPRAARHLFQLIESKPDATFDVRCSFVELHRDSFIDLLDGTPVPRFGDSSKLSRPKIEIRQKGSRVFLAGSPSLRTPVKTLGDALRIIADGQQRRRLASTKLNEYSSRSHAILTFYIKSTPIGGSSSSSSDALPAIVSHGKLHLVDLAGSERLDKSCAEGDTMKQTQSINASLTALGNVLRALALQSNAAAGVAAKPTMIPYRNNKLTRLLQDSIGGNSKTLFIVNVAPSSDHYQETRMSLRYGAAARMVTVPVSANNASAAANVDELAVAPRRTKPTPTVASSRASSGSTASIKLASTGTLPSTSSFTSAASAGSVSSASWKQQRLSSARTPTAAPGFAAASAAAPAPALISEAELATLKLQLGEFQKQLLNASRAFERERTKRVEAAEKARAFETRLKLQATSERLEKARLKRLAREVDYRAQTDLAEQRYNRALLERKLALECVHKHHTAQRLELVQIHLENAALLATQAQRQVLERDRSLTELQQVTKRFNEASFRERDEQLCARIAQLEHEASEREARVSGLSTDVARLEAELQQQRKQHASELSRVTKELEQVSATNSELSTECEQLREKRRKYRTDIKVLQHEDEQRAAELASATAKINELERSLAKWKQHATREHETEEDELELEAHQVASKSAAVAATKAKAKAKNSTATAPKKRSLISKPTEAEEVEIEIEIESEAEPDRVAELAVEPEVAAAENEPESDAEPEPEPEPVVKPAPTRSKAKKSTPSTLATTKKATAATTTKRGAAASTTGGKRKRAPEPEAEREDAENHHQAVDVAPAANKKRRLMSVGKQAACVLSPVAEKPRRRTQTAGGASKPSSLLANAIDLKGSSGSSLLDNLFQMSFSTGASSKAFGASF